jgi:23S rRNA U2552 (ribose-2'-O)-methylase RlmE/FtsJ
MIIINQFKGKKPIYRVTNPFEEIVDDYNDTISNACNKYFNLGKTPKILSRGFYKLWELLMTFDLIPLDGPFISAHLAEGPGSFIQATMFYRELFAKNSKNDKYHAVTLHPETELGHVPPLENEFIKFYEKENPIRFILHKTYSKQVAGGFNDKDNGDILDPKTHILFGGQIGEKVDFITADGGFNWKNENTQEQEACKLIIGQIIGAIKLQKKGGSFVCKLFETYTDTSVKILHLLTAFYESVYVVKPLMSRPSNSEKYVVCSNFKFSSSDKLYISSVKQLDDLLNKSFKTKKNIFDIFPKFKPNVDFVASTIVLNNAIANQQFVSINEIVKFIESQNYYGDAYHLYREIQINASKYWINTYLPSKNKLNEVKKILFDKINLNIKKNDGVIKELLKKITII